MIPHDTPHATRIALVVGFLLHTVMALWTWHTWGTFTRGGLIVWMDFPLSLAYVQLRGNTMLVASLLLGGLQWAAIAALLTLGVGRTLRGRRSR